MVLSIFSGLLLGLVLYWTMDFITPARHKFKSDQFLFKLFTALVVIDLLLHYFSDTGIRAFPDVFSSVAIETYVLIPFFRRKIKQ